MSKAIGPHHGFDWNSGTKTGKKEHDYMLLLRRKIYTLILRTNEKLLTITVKEIRQNFWEKLLRAFQTFHLIFLSRGNVGVAVS
jgi:hypothetical protein